MKSAEIREAFLSFFEKKSHKRVESSSLIPANDPTLLFANAGMVQFKDVFLGQDKRDYKRATSSQKCVRAGGKHNDLENVGYTARHHTFFEMLGNFSFGDYFKKEAIHYAWEFLTSTKWLGLPVDKLCVTVYADDDEAYNIWLNDIGVDAKKIIRIGDNKGKRYQSDNFWAMGDTGPCGPCTEIFYDHGEDIWGGPPGSAQEDGDRFIEIWNVVFMQFNRNANGELNPLPKPSVDTGMGLERVAAVMQHVNSNYDIDLFQSLLKDAAKATNTVNLEEKSLRVIADHIRSCAFLIADGVLPSNEGRGYVLRRIIRRAVRHGNKLGQKETFFYTLVHALVSEMGEAFSQLVSEQENIARVLKAEEEQFAKTLEKGMAVLDDALTHLKSDVIPGDIIFTLYDTYGFPVDLTNDIAREKSLKLDMTGYEVLMGKQREMARASGGFKTDYSQLSVEGETVFTGYDALNTQGKIVSIALSNDTALNLSQGDNAAIVLDNTAFYAQSGGQEGDSGYIQCGEAVFEVLDCKKLGAHHLHIGKVIKGSFSIGDVCDVTVDSTVRSSTALNHSATHILHAALRKILGDHVSQKGSLVDSQKLRFDFSHFEAVTKEQLHALERAVNAEVRANSEVQTSVCDMETAKSMGAMALFGEKYGDEVRVLSMGDGYSVELCGGTHVKRTGDIGVFVIASESGIASGVRRIEAFTGEAALDHLDKMSRTLHQTAELLKSSPDDTPKKLQQLIADAKDAEKQLAATKSKLAALSADSWLEDALEIKGYKFLAKSVDGVDPKSLRDLVDKLKNKLGDSAVLVASVNEGKVALVAGVSKPITGMIKAGDLVKFVADKIDGKGGGRPDMAQGGGTNIDALPEALAALQAWAKDQ